MVRHSMVRRVNLAFEEAFSGWEPPHSIHLRLLGDCMLRTISEIRRTDPEEPPDMKGMMNMSYGSAYEVWMTERLRVAGLLKYGGILGKDLQIRVRIEEYNGSGYMDALIEEDSEDIAVEIKSCGSRRFNDLIKDGKPTDQHFYQLMAYMHFLKIKKGRLIYIDRETFFENRNGQEVPRWEAIEVKYDPELGKKLERRLKKLYQHTVEGTTPEKEPKSASDPRCTWCFRRKECWGSAASSGNIGSNARAKRIAQNSQARRRERTSITGPKSTEQPK